MTVILVRVPKSLLYEMDRHVHAVHMSRAEYIRCAIEWLNKEIESKRRVDHLKKASLCVRDESMRINAEFNKVENDPED